jgi:PAS domain S-box-containing protein
MDHTNDSFRPIDRSRHELLIVNDDPASRYATVRLLGSAGFRIREAASGAEGLAAADDGVSAMVLDVHLPDIDGFELCRLLRSRPATSRLPVLHLTAAYVTDEDKVRGLDSGADAYLTHPVEPAVLVATVQALVRTRVAEEAMRRSEEKFRAIYARAPGGICLLDEQGRFIDANPAMLGFLGRDLRDVTGQPVSAFVPPEWAERVEEYTQTSGADGASREFPLLDALGRQVHLEWMMTPHIEPGVAMAVATDISQRMLLEHQRQQLFERERVARSAAERMSRMKDELIAVLSHELRTPLNAIMGWAHVLQKRGPNEETRRGLEAIERNGHMQARMISDIFDMSRLNTGKMSLALEMIDPAEVLTSAVDAMRPSIADNGQTLVLELQARYRPVRADSARLQQVIWNLLSNASKFSPPGGEIRVSLREDERGLRLLVADQGQGIEPEFMPYLFDRFTQGATASTRLRGGLGLGLSIVKHLVEAHGGWVSAYSEGVGRGTVFDVWLPADALPAGTGERRTVSSGKAARDQDLREDSLAGLQLLVVDDDQEAHAMLEVILGDHGAVVKAAQDCDDALRILQAWSPDLVISDIGMPGKDGYQLVREIRRRELGTGRRLPAIALTSFTRPQDREQALEAGFDAHCPKPLRPLQLIRQILALVGEPLYRQQSSGR